MLNTAKRLAAGAGPVWRVSPALSLIVLLGTLAGGCGACSCPGGMPAPGSDAAWPGTDAVSGWDAGTDAALPGTDMGLVGLDASVECTGADLFWSEVAHDKENAVVTLHNWPCVPIGPVVPTLYVYNDLCYGTVVGVERLDETTGAWVPLTQAWDCALGGPTDPVEIPGGEDYIVVFGRNMWLGAADPGTYRVVFWVSDWWSCPSGDIWMCVNDHPWEVHITPSFYWSN